MWHSQGAPRRIVRALEAEAAGRNRFFNSLLSYAGKKGKSFTHTAKITARYFEACRVDAGV